MLQLFRCTSTIGSHLFYYRTLPKVCHLPDPPIGHEGGSTAESVAGVLDELYSQLTPLSGVAVQVRQST
jgi:hypothetical protein